MALNARFDAVVLAGGARDAVCAGTPGAPNKAFVPVAGVTLVARTLKALRATPAVRRIVAVAPPGASAATALYGADEIRQAGDTMSASLRAGLAPFAPSDLVLVTASDLPILTRAALEEFLGLAERAQADVVYACVERRRHEARFPGVPHTWARLREGTFCGGGCVALRPRALDALDRFLGRLGAARKNPLRLASVFGYDVLWRYALRRLSIADAERRAGELLGVRVAAAVCSRPEIAINVDRASDLRLAERLIAEFSASG
jgi:molybdopterin-guanine dinucleotide biosynthesis protein A